MKLIYATNLYYERYQINYIIKQYKCYERITGIDKEFILCITTDNLNKTDEIIKNIREKLPFNFSIIIDYNWAGNIGSLYKLFKQYINNKDTYIAFFEEDFVPIDNKWLTICQQYLTNDVALIGSTDHTVLDKIDPNLSTLKVTTDRFPYLNKHLKKPEYHWTDGGFYFSTIEKLQIIENKIGIFHKGDPTTKYDKACDGVQLGEVGFPTLVYNSGLKIIPLRQSLFFHHKRL